MTHQDCLKSWLEVKGGTGKCDLCKCKFHFRPKYAEDAPEKLSTLEVISGISLRATSKWLPYALRVLLVAFVWLGVLPLVTAYLYQCWMHRPASIDTRWELALVPGDLVNGAILTVTIIISFLSLMSLGEFFRFNWHRGMGGEADDDGEKDKPQVKIAPVQIGEDRECMYYDDSATSLAEKFDAEKHIIEKMIKESNKSVMDGGQMFQNYQDDSRDGDVITEDSTDDLREMERRLAARETNDDKDEGNNDQDNDMILGGGIPAVRRQRHRHNLSEAGSETSDNGNSNNGGDSESDEDEDEMFERMMRLQEGGLDDEPEHEPDQPARPDQGRNNPRNDPLDMPFDEAAMVSFYCDYVHGKANSFDLIIDTAILHMHEIGRRPSDAIRTNYWSKRTNFRPISKSCLDLGFRSRFHWPFRMYTKGHWFLHFQACGTSLVLFQ